MGKLLQSLYSTVTRPLDELEKLGHWGVLHFIEKFFARAHPNLPVYYDHKIDRYCYRDVSIRNFRKSFLWLYTKASTFTAYFLVIARSKYLFSKLISGVEKVNIVELMINVYGFALFTQVVVTLISLQKNARGYCWAMNQLKGKGNRKRTSGIYIPILELCLVATALGFAVFPLGASIFPFIAPYDPASFMVHFSARHFIKPYFPEYLPSPFFLRVISSILISVTVWPVAVPACLAVVVLLSGGCSMNEVMKSAHSNISFKVRQKWLKGAKFQGKVEPAKPDVSSPKNEKGAIPRQTLHAIDQLGIVSFTPKPPSPEANPPNPKESQLVVDKVRELISKNKWLTQEHDPEILRIRFRESRMLYSQVNIVSRECNRNMDMYMPVMLGVGVLVCTIGYFSAIRLWDSLPLIFDGLQLIVSIMITLIICFLIPVGATLLDEYDQFKCYWSRVIRTKAMKKELMACFKIAVTVGPYMDMSHGLTIDMMYSILDKTFLLIML